MGRNSGGVTGGSGAGMTAYQRATTALYAAFQGKNKGGVKKAGDRLSALIAKQSDEIVKQRAKSFSEAAYWSAKSRSPKSEYNSAAYHYNTKISSLYNREMRKRKLK